jgi:drug/metabolite transporter (DMT)-like permease
MSLALAALAALCYGAADFSGGVAARKGSLLAALLVSQAAGAVLALAFLLVSAPAAPAPADLAWGLAAGLFGVLGLAALYRGLATSLVALVSPTAAVIGAALPVAAGLLAGERPSGTALVGTALCLPAVALLSWERGDGSSRQAARRALLYGVLAGIPIGAFFVALSRTSPGSGLWPLVAARAASVPLLLAATLATRRGSAAPRAALAPALGAGLADMAANILFLLASRGGLLSLVAVITSLYPAPTAILAAVVLRERIPATRVAGLGLAVAGMAFIAWK